MNYILDSYALIALINKEVGSEIVSNLIKEGYAGKVSLYMSTINYGELLYQLPNKRFGNHSIETIEMRLNALPVNYITPDIGQVKNLQE